MPEVGQEVGEKTVQIEPIDRVRYYLKLSENHPVSKEILIEVINNSPDYSKKSKEYLVGIVNSIKDDKITAVDLESVLSWLYRNAEGKKAGKHQKVRRALLGFYALAAVKESGLLRDKEKQLISSREITSKYEKILLRATLEHYKDGWLDFRLEYLGVPFTQTPKRTDVVLFDTSRSIIEKAFSHLRMDFKSEPARYYFEHTCTGVESLLSLSIEQAYYDLLNLRVTEPGAEVTGYSDYISGIKCDGSPFVAAIAGTGKTLDGYIKECRDKGWLPLFVKKQGDPQIQSIFLPEDLKYSEFVKLCQTIVEISGKKAAFIQEIPTLMLNNWSAFEWQDGWKTNGMKETALRKIDGLSYSSIYGKDAYQEWKTVPAVFFDLNSGRPVPTQIFIEYVPLRPIPMEEKKSTS
ncbi:MAG: hypothetical protein QXL47_01635 [Candidatus Anstonellales archaeon]